MITMENLVIKGYHHFKLRPLIGMGMYVVRERDNPFDSNAYAVKMPALSLIPLDKRDIVTDAKRGTTVRAIAGKTVRRLPAGLCKVLVEMNLSGVMCVAMGQPKQSYRPWPAPTQRGGGAVIPCELHIEVAFKDKETVMAQLRQLVERHMTAVKDVITIR